ncbi:L,D-transpeptidase [Mesorhizobium sp. BR1-1-14]|uniref:L,D-transpeptidase n=1 Tax=Mesorhizobium sp. BR1-1-14 TaxID=2876655 RepID=UPI001CD10C16|nr:L,D-transpeptidase [Mesorhizobium sp. BR1-1-14]MBZ9959323.1 L,D-transpeptidase [Mesorhizobium sp. BR1-1-14]
MARAFEDLLNQLNNAATANDLIKAYEDILEPDVLEFGETTIREPSVERIAQWLQLYSSVSDLSLEGAADITQRFYETRRDLFEQAIDTLIGKARQDAMDFVDSRNAPDMSMSELEALTLDAFPSAILADAPRPLAIFAATTSISPGSVRRYDGTLTVFNSSRQIIGTYAASTGGFVADFRRKNGPTPPGLFDVSHYRPDRGNTPGMRRDGVSYSFDLNELRHTGSRSAFRIHPDGPPPGTHGCIGVDENSAQLRDCASKLNETLMAQDGRFRLAVSYGNVMVPALRDLIS